jgi:membrane protease YdiL (CAAX protease family)
LIKEIAAGFLGYLACFPLLIAGAIVSVLLMFAWQIIQKALGGTPPNAPANPLLDYFEQGPTLLILLATLAVVWAPIVEEVVFRGGLLRQLYTRTNIILAAIISSIVFAFMHGYPIIMLGSIIGLAMGLAMLRWFRGSLISCITAHAIHNALVSALLFTLVKLLG